MRVDATELASEAFIRLPWVTPRTVDRILDQPARPHAWLLIRPMTRHACESISQTEELPSRLQTL